MRHIANFFSEEYIIIPDDRKAKYYIYTMNIYIYAFPEISRKKGSFGSFRRSLRDMYLISSHAAFFADCKNHALQQNEEAQHESRRDALPIRLP